MKEFISIKIKEKKMKNTIMKKDIMIDIKTNIDMMTEI